MPNATDNTLTMIDSACGVAGAIPGVGEVLSGANAVSHGMAAVYDGYHGDRDGAINHGVQAAWNGVAAIPAVSEATGLVDAGLNLVTGGARTAELANGGDPSAIPGGIGDMLGGGAVALTNMLFGADEDAGTGSKSTETALATPAGWIAAGLGHFGEDNPGGGTSGKRGPGGAPNGWAQEAGDAPRNWMANADREIRRLYGVPGM